MNPIKTTSGALALAVALAGLPPTVHAASEAQSLDELRNTVVNLLDSLVAKGVLTREQAQSMVAQAQARAEQDARNRARDAAPDPDDVRVTYVPQVVKDEISAQVAKQVTPVVVNDVVAQARSEQWGVPGALPDWVRGLDLSADLRLRNEWNLFASSNQPYTYLNYQVINTRGGIGKAGQDAFLNTTEDQMVQKVRARANLEANLGEGLSAAIGVTTGNFTNPVSTNQSLQQYDGRYTFGLDAAYLRYDLRNADNWSELSIWGGRAANPFLTTDLVWDGDVSFQGLFGTYRYAFDRSDPADHHGFLTMGAFPIQQPTLSFSSKTKWLFAAQLGATWQFADEIRVRGAVAYYDYYRITGKLNSFGSTTENWTAPLYVQKGNTMFDILNDTDPSTNLFALAAGYQLLDAVVTVEAPVLDQYLLTFTGDFVDNLGWNTREVRQRTGTDVVGRTLGYQFEIGFGSPAIDRLNAWRAAVRYRYLQRDAVLDAFNDSDFHLGGTDAAGYTLRGDYGLGKNVYATVRYMSANAIDDAPLGIDVIYLDVNGRF